MFDALKALPRLLLDPLTATCLVVAVVSAITFFKGRKEKTLTKGMRAALIILFALTAGTVLLTVALVLVFGPPPA
ncbi:MAG: hypothetical protein LBI19_03515 [Oscillospiraceae bacterium]|jgi:hypothetical protein|nr:hypothetical protein [Oscillospiraceae bacterium]